MQLHLIRCLFIAALVFRLTTAGASGFEFTDNCRQAYKEMLQLNFAATASLLQKEKNTRPANGAIYYIEGYSAFLKAFITEEDADYHPFRNQVDNRLTQIDKTGSVSPWAVLAKGEMLLQLGILKLKRKEYISAGYFIRKAYKILEENHRKYPAFAPNLKALGFFHASIGSVPENYKWLANLVGMHGSIAQGVQELSMLMNRLDSEPDFHFMKEEIYFIRIFMATHFEKNVPGALALLAKSANPTAHARSPLLHFLEANTLIAAGRPGDALKILDETRLQHRNFRLFYLDYLSGMLRINQLDTLAMRDFTVYVESFKGKSFVKSAYHKMAWICLLKNDTDGYRHYLEKVKIYGDEFADEDKQAMKDALAGDVPNITLLRARLLFDGANYNAALGELANKPAGSFAGLRDQLEYTYRLARIFDKKGQTDKAIKYYTTTYENGIAKEWYFAANAALHNGLIYETRGDASLAEAWYRKCLALRNHEYQNSIDQKAETGLNRLKTLK